MCQQTKLRGSKGNEEIVSKKAVLKAFVVVPTGDVMTSNSEPKPKSEIGQLRDQKNFTSLQEKYVDLSKSLLEAKAKSASL